MKKLWPTIYLFFTLSICASAYNYLPIVKSYDKNEYNAGRQNWDIAIDNLGIVYFANNNGLLRNVFGIWQLNTTTNNDLVRSLLIINDTIWCGGSVEFGYFVKKSPEDLVYQQVGQPGGGSIWNIKSVGDNIYFQTEFAINRYNKKSGKIAEIALSNGFYCIESWKNKLWAVARNGSIGIIENDTFISLYTTNVFAGIEVRQLFEHTNKLYLLLFDGRIYSFDGKFLIRELLPPSISGRKFFSSCSYNDESYCIGTISDGFIQIDNNTNQVVTRANSENGLIDNTVLALERDNNGNIWLGLDYGIAYIELQNVIKPIFDQGATYFIKEFNNKTYLATNKGLYLAGEDDPFTLLPKSEGQVWKLRIIDNTLYVCHNMGLLNLNGNILESIYSDGGVMDVAAFEGTRHYLVTTYTGLYRATYDGKSFKMDDKLIMPYANKLDYDPTNECIWVRSTANGLGKFTLTGNSELKQTDYPRMKNFFRVGSMLAFHDGSQLVEFKNGEFLPITKTLLNAVKGDDISALSMEKNGSAIAYIQNGLPNMLINLSDGSIHSYDKLLNSVKNSLVKNHEFIDIHNGELRMATDRGVITFNPESGSGQINRALPVISKMVISTDGAIEKEFIYPFNGSKIVVSPGIKDIMLYFGIFKSSSDFVEFRYRLWPYDESWSGWESQDYSKSYTRLKGGNYSFELEARLNGAIVNTKSLPFVIEKYWYQTKWIGLIYFLLFMGCIVLTIYIMHIFTRRKVMKEQILYRQNVTKKTINIKNEQLLQYAEIIGKKNEFLMQVREGLSRMRNTEAKHWENKILDEVSNEKKNFFFHKLFSELHQDFITRLTDKHPELTPHDVRILSFIRINLGTTEIANLMNISPKSVDINRYRIRKKLGLSHETDLNMYIREL